MQNLCGAEGCDSGAVKMISGRSVEGCEMVRYEGSLWCDKAKGVGSMK